MKGPSLFLAILLLLAPLPLSGAPAAPVQARLLRGPLAVRGLPFFSPNALPALQGEYSLGQDGFRVWSCRQTLFFGTDWKLLSRPQAGEPGLRLLDGGAGVVLALQAEGYTLFVEASQDGPIVRRFASSLERRFRSFFLNAPTDAELSFPAFVELQP